MAKYQEVKRTENCNKCRRRKSKEKRERKRERGRETERQKERGRECEREIPKAADGIYIVYCTTVAHFPKGRFDYYTYLPLPPPTRIYDIRGQKSSASAFY